MINAQNIANQFNQNNMFGAVKLNLRKKYGRKKYHTNC